VRGLSLFSFLREDISMKLFSQTLVTVILLLGVVAGAWWVVENDVLDRGITIPELPVPTPGVRPRPPASATPVQTVTEPKAPAGVVCEGCERTPSVTVEKRPAPIAVAGRIAPDYRYTPEPYTVLGSQESYPHNIVREVLERLELGHLSFSIDIPNVAYDIQGTPAQVGTYMIRPSDVKLAGNPSLPVRFSIRYPVLSDEQFAFVRDKRDYRWVYGLIRGVVGHEERHYHALRTYIGELETILNNPLGGTVTVQASSDDEFQAKASALVSKTLSDRLAASRKKHEAAQDNIDDPAKKQRIEFRFEDDVNGHAPPTIVADFIGEGTFTFDPLSLPAPRPPVPNIPK
jgi:hypothetical protein